MRLWIDEKVIKDALKTQKQFNKIQKIVLRWQDDEIPDFKAMNEILGVVIE